MLRKNGIGGERGAHLQSLAIAHHGLDGERLDGACKGLYPGFAPCSATRAPFPAQLAVPFCVPIRAMLLKHARLP